MAGQIKFKLVSAPYQEDTGSNGLIDNRQVWPSGGVGYEYTEVDLGAEIPRIGRFTSGVQYSAMLRTGTARSLRIKPDSVGMSVSSKNWAPPATHDLYKMWQSGKPFAFTPWWDQHTLFCSTFGQVDIGAGISEIGGNTAASLVPRMAPGDYYPNRFDKNEIGWLTPLLTGEKAKLVPGMIGNAILLERLAVNKAPLDPAWVAGGNAFVQDMDDGNNNLGHTKMFHSDGSTGAQTASVTVAGLTTSTEYTVSVWAKGHGKVYLIVTGVGSGGTQVDMDSEKWQRVWYTFTSTGTSHTFHIAPNIGGSEGCLCSFSSFQIEEGDSPTSYMDPSKPAATAADEMKILSPLGRSPDMTVAFWFKRDFAPSGDYKYFMSASDAGAGSGYWILLGTSNTLSVNLADSGLVSASIGAPTGNWEQIVAVRTFDTSNQHLRLEVYHNGALLTSATYTPPYTADEISTFPEGMYIGSGLGLLSPSNLGADMPIDRFRVDGRAWSLQNIEDDYEMFRHEGVRAFLAQVAGRYFRVTTVPGSFRGGVDPGALQGAIQLEQVGVNPAGVPS